MPEDAPVPDFAGSRDRVLGVLVTFARRLRADGVSVPADAAGDAARALAVVGLDDRRRVETALRASLVADPRDADRFDDRFPAFWDRLRDVVAGGAAGSRVPGEDADGEDDWSLTIEGAPSEATGDPEMEEGAVDDGATTVRLGGVARDAGDGDGAEPRGRPGSFSPVGRREQASGEDGSGSLVESDVRAFERALAAIPGRRPRRASGPRVDRRRTLRRSLATGGVPVALPTRRQAETAFRVTVLADVSRSVVDALDRGLLLALLARLHRDGRGTRTFFFDTDLRDVSGAFADARGDPTGALEAASVEWGGGTRIGAALQALRRDHADAVDRRRVVLVVSDGLDVGDLDDLRAGMSWLAGRSRAVLWLNPLAASPAYEPTARGMATALPYVDGLFAFGASSDLAEIARQLRLRGLGGPLGYEYDPRRRVPA